MAGCVIRQEGCRSYDLLETECEQTTSQLRSVDNQSAALVAEFTYNGLGHRTGWLSDTTANGTVDGSDDWMYFAYDDRWRIAATFWEGADPDEPYEQFTYHNAGLDGQGGSSYIDAVVLRDRDEDVSEDGVLEERVYICQNWRADVSALLTDAGIVIGWAKFSAYGVPHGLPGGDTDSDGDYDGADATAITGGGYDVRKDVNLDGSVDIFDATDAANIHGGTITLGRNVMTGAAMGVRKGYAGYELDPSLWGNATKGRTFWHVRHRVLDSGLGRWVQAPIPTPGRPVPASPAPAWARRAVRRWPRSAPAARAPGR